MINHSFWVGHKICLGICIIWKEINVQCLMFNVQLKSIKPLQPRLSSQFDTWITGSLDALMTNNQNNHQLLTFRQNFTLHSSTCNQTQLERTLTWSRRATGRRSEIWRISKIKGWTGLRSLSTYFARQPFCSNSSLWSLINRSIQPLPTPGKVLSFFRLLS